MNVTTLPRPAAAAARVTPNLKHAFGGIFRLTLRRFLMPMHWLTILGLCGLLIMASLPAAPSAAAAKVGLLTWVVNFYLSFIVPIMAFIAGAGAIRDEMKAGNVDYVFTRPISRPAFLAAKYLSHLACVQCEFLLSFATVLGIAAYREFPMGSHIAALLGAQVLLVAAFTAFGFACGIATTRYIVIGIVYGAIVEVGVGQIPTQISKISMTHQIQAALKAHYVPVAELNSPGVIALADASAAAETSMGATIVLLLGFTAIMLFIAGAVFSFLELSGPNEA